MGLYYKQLKGIDDIKRERAKLKAVQRVKKLQDEKEEHDNGGGLLSLAGGLLGPRVLLDTAMALRGPLGKMLSRRKKPTIVVAEHGKRSSLLMRGVKEVALGYAKWKLLELGLKGAKKLVKTAKEKRHEKKLQEQMTNIKRR